MAGRFVEKQERTEDVSVLSAVMAVQGVAQVVRGQREALVCAGIMR